MYQISREYWFSASHRLEGHPKCGRLHGHNYKVNVTLVTDRVDDFHGWIMDYGALDKIVKPIIDQTLDHRHIVSRDNIMNQCPVARVAAEQGWAAPINVDHSTAEELAEYLYSALVDDITEMIPVKLEALSILIQETPKSFATYGDAI